MKNFPLPGHKQAHLAAQAALAAGEQGKYGEMRDLLLANQDDLGRAALESYAQKLDLDLARFRRALDDKRFAAQVDRDVEEGKAAGLTGVPAFVINGRAILGARPLEEMKKIVDEELAR
jgi:protein-disulfide isomerase